MQSSLLEIFNKDFQPVPKQSTVPHCLNSSFSAQEIPHFQQCFAKLGHSHITATLPQSFDPHQFVYRANRSTGEAVGRTLHAAPGAAGELCVDALCGIITAFNTILPHKLVAKVKDLGLPQTTYMWINSFLSDRRQQIRVGHHHVC